jgi:hypothetical protein
VSARTPLAAVRAFAVLVVLAVVASYGASLVVAGASAAPIAPAAPLLPASHAPLARGPDHPAALPHLVAGPGNASGPGIFYSTSALPGASFANSTCISGLCYSVTNDVSSVVTPNGTLVAAYTTLTDQSPCAALRPYSVSNIAIETSTNGGSSWSPVEYVGNPDCTATGYPDAWQPSVAALANGTLVLSYVEYNLSAGSLPPLTQYSWPPTESRLVLTESYDGGATWSTPAVLNISNPPTAPPGLQFTPAFPSVATIGDTIYVTWMSLTVENSEGSIALLVSSDGGRSWSPTLTVSTGLFAGYSMDPQAIVLPNGELVIAYTGNVSYTSFLCGNTGCTYFPFGTWTGNVWVASSFYNGTVFNYTEIAEELPLGSFGWDPYANPTSFGAFETPAPQLAYSAATGQIYLAFTAGVPTNSTSYCPYPSFACLADDLFFYDSPDNGSTWFEGNISTAVFNPAAIDPSTSNLNATDSVPSVALATAGSTVYLEAAYYNGSLCETGACGVSTEIVLSTSDNGTTFSPPVTIAAQYTPYDYAWTGEYGSVAIVNGTPRYFWTLNSCPGWATVPCGSYPYSNLGLSAVSMSELFNGTGGATITISPVGLGVGANWTATVLGNPRSGAWNQSLSVSGIPKGVPIFFSVPGVNETTVRYYVLAGAIVPSSPVVLKKSLSVTVTFTEYVPVTISYSVPNIQGPACESFGFSELSGCPSFYPGCLGKPDGNFTEACYSYYFNPIPPVGANWVPAGHADSVSLDPLPYPVCWYYYGGVYGYTECYIYNFQLEPLGWSGTGPGSVSTSALNITFDPVGPVTETASFLETGVCISFLDNFTGFYSLTSYGCENFTAALTVEEKGLPAGTPWAVTFGGAAGSTTNYSIAGTPIVNDSAGVGIGKVTPWNIPSSTPGEVWVGTPSVLSPMILPQTNPIVINYTLEPLAAASEPVEVRAIGLPAGIQANLTADNLGTGASTVLSAGLAPDNTSLAAGDYSLNASAVITTGGTSYYPTAIYSDVDLLNDSNQSGTSPSSLDLGAPALITVAYAAEYWVSIAAGAGGTVTPASQGVTGGGTIDLTATPNSGFEFLYWVGSGLGSTSGPQALLENVVIAPGGPITELATFGFKPAPTYTVTVEPEGLPSGQEYSVSLGTSTYSGVGTLTIANLSTGTYAVSLPDVESPASTAVRYVLSSIAPTPGLSNGELAVNANVTLYPVYETEYLVAISTIGNGTVNVTTGSYWEPANTTFEATATPATNFVFSGWWAAIGGGSSSEISTSEPLELVVTSYATLVAQFVAAPPVVTPTYSFTFSESGLPAGALWQVTLVPGVGVSGRTSNLTVTVPNGTYVVNVATVYITTGVRYVSNVAANTSLSIPSGGPALPIVFSEQFLVTVSASGGGNASGGGWATAGQSMTITAARAPTGWTFAGWDGTGSGSYSGTNASEKIVPNGPITETATYVPSTSTASTSASAAWYDYVALGLVVAVLLIVGLVQGLSVIRRRKPPATAAAPPARPAVRPAPTTPALPGAKTPPAQPVPTPAPGPSTPTTPPSPWRET